jgi:CBS domain containing-hemolysin-like protein
MTDVLRILGALGLVGLNAFFVATEFAVTRVRLGQIVELEKAGKPGARSARHAVEHIDAYLAACQLGITVASIGLGALAEPAFVGLLEPLVGSVAPGVAVGLSFALAFGLVTLLHVVLGELAPKSLAIARTTGIVLAVAPPMRAFYLATKPLVDLFNGLGNLVLKPFGVPPARDVGHAPHSEDELRMLLAQSVGEGLIDAYEREYAENALIFGDLRARQVMVPRRDIDYLVVGESIAEAVERASDSLHTRLPLCASADGLDDPVGVVNFKELLRLGMSGAEKGLEDLARPLARVSESMLVDEVLRELRRKRQHMALVVDEYGTTVGLVTLEDIVEEIVGEFEDEEEGDQVHTAAVRREGDDLLVPGAALLGEVEDALGVEIGNAGAATIGGHLIELLGRVPEAGEVVEVEGLPVTVLAVDEARVEELRIAVPQDERRDAV